MLFGLFVFKKNSDLWFILVEHESHELNESFYIKTCDSKIIRVIREIRVQKKLRSVVYWLNTNNAN